MKEGEPKLHLSQHLIFSIACVGKITSCNSWLSGWKWSIWEKTLEKKHPEYICSMRHGVMSSEINRFTRWVSSSEANEGIKEMQKEIVTLKETNWKIDELMEKIILLKQRDNSKK